MKCFFIGIKGSGMSALAIVLKQMGNDVLGSDISTSFFTEKNLIKEEINIYEFGEHNLDGVDVVVLGNAFDKSNLDYKKAKDKEIKIIKYYDALNELVVNLNSIAICGTNGKTTTTGLMVSSLKDVKPSFLIGDGTGFGNGNSNDFIFEACEYKSTFLNYDPNLILINNIEFDHPDYFKDLEHVIEVFEMFANKAKTIIINGDDENCRKIKHNNKFSFGTNSNCDLYCYNVKFNNKGIEFNLNFKNDELGQFTLPFYGKHMLYNSLGVILINLILNRDINQILENLCTFKGVDRRFNEYKLKEDVFLIDDYAHHATAIDLTLEAIRQKYPNYEVVTIFQPHTYSRVNSFKKEFAQSLISSDQIILVDIFASAREEKTDISIDAIKEEICLLGFEDKLVDFSKFDGREEKYIFCLLGAGDIDLLYKEKIIEFYKKK